MGGGFKHRRLFSKRSFFVLLQFLLICLLVLSSSIFEILVLLVLVFLIFLEAKEKEFKIPRENTYVSANLPNSNKSYSLVFQSFFLRGIMWMLRWFMPAPPISGSNSLITTNVPSTSVFSVLTIYVNSFIASTISKSSQFVRSRKFLSDSNGARQMWPSQIWLCRTIAKT